MSQRNESVTELLYEKYISERDADQLTFGGDFDTVTRKPAIATIDYKNLDAARYPMFKKDQPAIGAYAQSNPDNFAKLIIFIFCSIQTEWPRLNAWFPIFWHHFSSNNGKIDWETTDPALASMVSWWSSKRSQIEFIWKYRRTIYTDVMRAVDADEKNGDTGFLVYRKLILVPGLGPAKAGFATQLLVGKMGCIDSVNLNIVGADVPDDIVTRVVGPSGRANTTFKGASTTSDNDSGGTKFAGKFKDLLARLKGDKDKENLVKLLYGHPTAASMKIQVGYMQFLKDLQDKETDSEMLWNIWCEVIAHKIHHFGGKPLDVILPNQTSPARVNSYRASSKEDLRAQRAKLAAWKGPGGERISRDHADLITQESKLIKNIKKALYEC